MIKLLGNLRVVAWASLAVAAVMLGAVATQAAGVATDSALFWSAALRWSHVLSGIMWIGHLYYFNFTQIPNAPRIPDEHRGPSVGKVIAPAALFWFRWGAVATLVTGLALAWVEGYLVDALTLGASQQFAVGKNMFIGAGMWLAIIMFINVWAIIWPNQQRALNIDDKFAALNAEQKAAAARTAMAFSRVNTFLSAPMLVVMATAQTMF